MPVVPGSPTPLPSLPASPESPTPFSSLPEIDTRADRVNLEARISYPGLELSDVYTTWKAQEQVSWWRRFWVLIVLAGTLVITAVVCGIIAGVLLKQPGPPSPSTFNSESDGSTGDHHGTNNFSIEVVVTTISGHVTTITRTGLSHANPTDAAGSSSPNRPSRSQSASKSTSSTKVSDTTSAASSWATTSKSKSTSGATTGSQGDLTLRSTATISTPTTITPASPPTQKITTSKPEQDLSPSSSAIEVITRTTKLERPGPTVDPRATPKFPVWIGSAVHKDGTFQGTVAFVETGANDSGCQYTTMREGEGNPCGRPVLLADGLEYTWNGCGAATWIDWRNPASGIAKFQRLSSCVWAPETWSCGETDVKLGWRCPP